MNSYLEDEYKPASDAWKLDQTPPGNAAFLEAIHPIVQKGVQMYGGDSPLSASRGRFPDAVRSGSTGFATAGSAPRGDGRAIRARLRAG